MTTQINLTNRIRLAPDLLEEGLGYARAIISDPWRWCRGWEALNSAGKPTNPLLPGAERWCAQGACRLAGQRLAANYPQHLLDKHDTGRDIHQALHNALQPDDPSQIRTVGGINDGPDGHARIMAGFDRALANL